MRAQPNRLTICTVALFVIAGSWACAHAVADRPRVLDERLTFELFAEHPQIVTPTGIAVDAQGRVLAIESHTHFRPEGYKGPAADRIQLFEDTDDDGRADRVTTFFEGTTHTMNLAVYRDGSVYVATRGEVFRLRDTDNDGKADERKQIVRLDTAGNYPHNGLSGFAFDANGNVYFGLGENLGAAYKLIGSDGAALVGGGEGGSIYKCKLDGSKLERIATGFWNPFHLCLDTYERLFAVDNDPDWRPPCRLLHVVPGGDYGYQYRLGRRGTHPFTSWFGELPGTLGMVAGTGEAPSGIVSCDFDALPEDYGGNLLVTSWGVHAIERYRLQPHGATFRSTAETIVKGDSNFRPVGIALAPDGSYYISDWVDRSYELHGNGRIWRLAAKHAPPALPKQVTAVQSMHDFVAVALKTEARDAVKNLLKRNNAPEVCELAVRLAPVELVDLADIARTNNSALVRAAALRRLDAQKHHAALLAALGDADPFVRQAARTSLERTLSPDARFKLELPDDPTRRVEVALLLRGADDPRAVERLPDLLKDSNENVRFVALRWIGEERLNQFKPNVVDALNTGNVTARLFESYFACLSLLSDNVDATKFEADERLLIADWVAGRRDLPPPVLKLALRKMAGQPGEALEAKEQRALIDRILPHFEHDDPTVRVEVVRSVRELVGNNDELRNKLTETVLDEQSQQPAAVKAEAVAAISPDAISSLFPLANDHDRIVRSAMLRLLRGAKLTDEEKAKLGQVRRDFSDTVDLVDRLIVDDWKPRDRPERADMDKWLKLTAIGDAAEGERLFFHPQGPRCYACHQVDGRGGLVGPDLSAAGQLGERRLIESIVAPSGEMAPQFVPWTIQTTDGRVVTGVLVGERGEEEIYADADGRMFRVQHSDIEARKPLGKSIMPDGLVDTMTDDELRDLIAFLRERK